MNTRKQEPGQSLSLFLGVVGAIFLWVEAILQLKAYYSPVNPFTFVSLPANVSLFAGIYYAIAGMLPLTMALGTRKVKWGLLTLLFGGGGQYLTLSLMPGVGGLGLIIMILIGAYPLLAGKNSEPKAL
ncbi:MAG: hypothetical protein ACP5NK_06725 [Thermoplasmata archaeon]